MSAFLPFRPQRPRIHCSTDVLYHAGALKMTHAVGLMRDIEQNRPDLARRIARGEAVSIHSPIEGEMIVQQPASVA